MGYRKGIKVIALALACLLLLSACGEQTAGDPLPAPSLAPGPGPSPTPEPEPSAPGLLRISEVMGKNRATISDGEGRFPDWFELENSSDERVSLSGWTVSDKPGREGSPLPELTLDPGDRALIFLGEGYTGFSLSEGESLILRAPNGAVEDSVSLQTLTADLSLQRQENDAWLESEIPSPGYENSALGYDAWQDSLESGAPLQVWEVCVYNPSFTWPGLVGSDWVELKNVSSAALELSDYYISDDGDQPLLARLPEHRLESGETYLLRLHKGTPEDGYGPLCDLFALDDGGDQLYLSGADGTLLDYVPLRNIPNGCTLGREQGRNGWFRFPSPSPGANNSGGYRRVSPPPVALTADGVFDGVDSVPVELSGSGTVYYCLGAELPDESSQVYAQPFQIDSTGVVRAINVEPGAMPSRPLTLSYILNEGHSLPVVSLVADEPSLFDWLYGNRIKGMEVPASVSFYEQDGSFTIPCGIRMHGETSLKLPKKNMSLRFRGSYGADSLEYDIYKGGVSRFGSLILRAGQDFYSCILRNELCENLSLAASDSLIAQRNRYCVLYINGRYWGIYALTERTNAQMVANLYGVDESNVSCVEAPVWSNTPLYQDVFQFCQYHDLSVEENYQTLCSMLDVDNLIDWCLIEGWSANADLTYGNLRYCCAPDYDGRWRLILYDLDSTLSDPKETMINIFSPHQLQERQVSQLIAPLLKNAQFRDKLLSRAGELLNGPLSNEAVAAELDRLCDQLRPEVARDYARFGMTLGGWEGSCSYLRTMILDWNWAGHCKDNLCWALDLSREEAARYGLN